MRHVSKRHQSHAEEALSARLAGVTDESFPKEGRRYSGVPLVCDRCGRTATTSRSGGKDGHTMLCPECDEARVSRTAAREDLPLAKPGSVRTATDDYPELESVLWDHPDHIEAVPVQINRVTLGSRTARRVEGNDLKRSIEDPGQPWWWRKVVGPALDRVNDNLDPAYNEIDFSRTDRPDNWCRFRRESHCYFPKELDVQGTAEAGYSVWIPFDRGRCPRIKRSDQKTCKVSEPGPTSGERLTAPDATRSWAQGGQRFSSLGGAKTSAWDDVNQKAVRIRRDGGVRIISNTGATVTAEVNGDTHIYITSITRIPGGKGVGVWYCSCDWAKYAWDRTGQWKKYEGRKCAHATALLYEMQSKEMFGGEIHEVPEAPTWRHTEPRMDRRDGQELEEYGEQVYDLITASISRDLKLNAICSMQDAVIALTASAQGGHRDRLDSFLSSSAATRERIAGDDGRRHGAFTGQVDGRIRTDLELRTDGLVEAGGQLIEPRRVLYPTFDPSAGLSLSAARTHPPAGRAALLDARSAGDIRTAAMDAGMEDLLLAMQENDFTHAGLIIKSAASGRVLLTQRTPFHGDDEETYGKWEFPGGGLDGGEDALSGAIREFEEETGLSLPEGFSVDGHYENGHYVAIVITVPDESWTVNADLLDLETMGIGWFDTEMIEDSEGFVRPELLRVDFDMVREAVVKTAWDEQDQYESDMNSAFWKGQAEQARGVQEFKQRMWDMKGQEVEVVKGRKVPKGTRGTVFWVGDGQYGWRVGINTPNGETHWTAVSNVELVSELSSNAILQPEPEPVLDTGIAYGADDPEDDLEALGSIDARPFVPGDPRLSHLAGGGDSEGNEDIAAAAAAFLKESVKTFSPAEQQELIEEGGHLGASNDDRLQIAGTFYEDQFAGDDEIGWM